ncbi:hypothetical protein L2A60_03175 [Acidiphilium iwatense]|uniref:Uncharacterized protein n=1 Tax=Acidiphilium iwatense TaxID=768198 RepID=A0ABS9DW72_9PROT|nr:hypothetical protein [Acidiphilium iwatense]
MTSRRLSRSWRARVAFAFLLVATGFAHARTVQPVWFRILLPADQSPATIGRAAFRLGPDAVLVFAAKLPVGRSALRQAAKSPDAEVIHLPDATVLRLPLARGQRIGIEAGKRSFRILIDASARTALIAPSISHGQIGLPATAAGPTIVLANPRTGTPILVGTVTDRGALRRRLQGPGYAVIPAWRGVVVAAASDELRLVRGQAGFVLRAAASAPPLPIGTPPVPASLLDSVPAATGGLGLPRATVVALRRRMESAQRRLAAAPPLDRLAAALRLARILLALGLGPEAHGVLTDLLRHDPAAIDDPHRRALLAVADVLSFRPVAALAAWPKDQPTIDRTDLWRGLAEAERGKTNRAARLLSRAVSRLLDQPPLPRAQIAPLAAEALVAGGRLAAAQSLFAALPHERRLALARAEALQAAQHPRAALAAFDVLIHGPDQRTAGIARSRSILLRYRLHQIGAHDAAASLARHIYDWRGTRHELDMRIALARLRAKAAEWPRALMGLRRAERLFPAGRSRIQHVRRALFGELVTTGALDRLEPLAAIAVIQNDTGLIPQGSAGSAILRILSRHLVALDLPDTAAPVMRQLIARASGDANRARLGLALARIEIDAGHLKQAQTALDSTNASDIDPKLVAARRLVADEIAARQGGSASLAFLVKSGNPRALALSARIAAARHDWKAAQAALRRLAAIEIPPAGPLDTHTSRIVTQWASAASQAGDARTLARLRAAYQSRLPPGRDAALFDTITAPPLVRGIALSAALHQIAAIERAGAALAPVPAKPPKH